MDKYRRILLILLALTGLNPHTMSIIKGPYLTFSLFKVCAVIYLLIMTPKFLCRVISTLNSRPITRSIFYNGLFLTLFLGFSLLNIRDIVLTSYVNVIFFLVIFYIFYLQISNLCVYEFINILKFVINLYFITILISAFAYYVVGSELFMLFYIFDSSSTKPHFQGLATEPSHAAFVILASYLSLCTITKMYKENVSFLIHFSVFVMVILIQSTFGYLLYFGVFTFLIYNKVKKFKNLCILFILAFAFTFQDIYLPYFVKLNGIFELITTLDFNSSRYGRIRTMGFITLLFDYPSFNLFNQLFGHGTGTGAEYIYKLSNGLFNDGQFANFLYDYGIVGLIIFYSLVFYNFERKFFLINVYFLALLLFNANISSQMYWWTLLMLFSIKLYSKRQFKV